MKYEIRATIKKVVGYEYYEVEAESKEDALDKFDKNSICVSNEIEVLELDDITLDNIKEIK